MKCNKCGYENSDDALYCGLCSEVFKKEHASVQTVAESAAALAGSTGLGRGAGKLEALKWCLLSFILAFLITQKIYLIWFPFRFVTVFCHEMGHTVLSWLFGYFTIPAVNPIDTGGVAISISYDEWVPYVIIAVLGWLTYEARKIKYGIVIGLAVIALYGLAAFTSAKDWLISAGGILGEYVLAGVCLYLCLFKKEFKIKFERVLYGLLGWFAVKQELLYLYSLKTDRSVYENYVFGTSWQEGMTGDLARIAFDINYRFSKNSFETIVLFFMTLGALVPVIIVGYYFLRTEKGKS